MRKNSTGEEGKFTPVYGKNRVEADEGTPKITLQSFQQLMHGPLRTIRGYANLLAYQEVPASKALRELQEASDELSFFHLESNRIYQAQLGARPDEPFEVRELVDRAISFLTTALIQPTPEILYHYQEEEHHYRTANKAAVTSLIYNFILHRIAHAQPDDNPADSPAGFMFFEIRDTSAGIQLTHCVDNTMVENQPATLSGQAHWGISDQLAALVEITEARLDQYSIDVPLGLSKRQDREEFSILTGKVICANEARQRAISNRLGDLGLRLIPGSEEADCYFIDAENQKALRQQIDNMPEFASVFLFNYTTPWGNTNSKPLKYPMRQSELVFELSHVARYLARARAEGPHVMVVDDNPQNLRLVVTHLESLGIRTTSAIDGIEAISLFGEHIDLVFMDLHMPRMNGFEASLALRNAKQSSVPIVALSADLSPDDMSEALQCGINDIHKKPIDRAIIEQALIQHVSYNPEKLTSENVARKPPARKPQTDELEVVDIELSLTRADNRPALAKEMMEMLIESLPGDIEQLNAHLQQQDYSSMGLIAHRIKGACCYCGVPKFEESIRKLHLLLKSRAALEVPAEKDTLLDDSINALVLIVNHDATNLIDWHLGHRNPFFKQLDDQGLG